ncbi:prephenate dehydratase [Streptomyces sp. ME02-8801-2C]|uniref:prephenate dehydratase n=1 Tax=Streptomyces sp. ME02-8801-2C TaxID=3028680 RepID=UPI0029B7F139|nr:prephenate dehydratase [Streptomyces sp. ME02-8801-2C]MDX3455870.1 prephenate dehydratase [Streptomyces sp. ME02-8801-2C]
MKYAYLGPEGTFTESAVRRLTGGSVRQAVPFASVPAAVEALTSGRSERTVVPLENSVSGVVPATLGELVAHAGHIRIDAQVSLGVSFDLMAAEGTQLSDVRRVITHPHAHGQCGRWVRLHLPHAELVTAASTAEAARSTADSRSPGDAAIASSAAAARYGLTVLASDIGARQDAMTRFVSLRRSGPEGPTSDRDRTALLITSDSSDPGVLTGVLGELSVRRISVAWIQSWPRPAEHGRYHFLVEAEGHIEEGGLAEAVVAMRRGVDSLTLLGSYPYLVDRALERTAA